MDSPLLRRLRDLPTFEMATGDPDPRGWAVRGSDGKPFGTVHELLVDPVGQRVLYLDVVLATGLPGVPAPAPHTDQRILLPLAAVNLDPEGSSVFVTSLNHDNISRYPLFVDFILPVDFEEIMREKLGLS
ncbi:PRC-barrel domain-containing protein [Hymenobacter sp. H14-R3]|uniref:PRC-barrel domain-containing protein n=1 Tax=Hymenobacter sp. H14-R3 TaxID=3046308 RepID=UPI0024B89F09|nr:PRC-barrel domain-containing protein [Hymenobacter sp. H14-R3]MDJ0364976.1 PRC-barrel domain-containing protein [Hymenobacter sp. H14-R3]